MKPIPLHRTPRPVAGLACAALEELGVDFSSPQSLAATLPFSPGDSTCGCENELQASVSGARDCVDLPLTIEASHYFQNVTRRHRSGEMPRRALSDLESWLQGNKSQVWENSWVRLPLDRLSPLAASVLERDMLRDKADPSAGSRGDLGRFMFEQAGRPMLRVPVSYLLKLALAEAVGCQERPHPIISRCGQSLLSHYICDNTSPELSSFYVCRSGGGGEGLGLRAARESSRRFLLTQLLVRLASRRFGLERSGQHVAVYFSPHPPVRQKQLSQIISDSFYRELYMNPCLSGWDRGEDKHRYMHLCHEVLSRAQLNALGRLKEAGIITRNLVVLPAPGNISLANNGTHVSLGSRMLSRAAADEASGFTPRKEKALGDLVIKAVEHFLPLFVGRYSAAPYRLAFSEFHPEKVLSFLPYEMDYTHLRMLWRRWKKKARLKVWPLGLRVTPFGPELLDAALGRLPGLDGDYVPDFRLLDYLAATMSTHASPALDGTLGNQQRLKDDLAHMGVFDPRMPPYMLYRQRMFGEIGYSGFEGRHYSVFQSFGQDMAQAVELQNLVTALAFFWIAKGSLTHAHIPDDPETESERRQIFFCAAVDLPTFYVRADTRNLFLRMILEQARGIRHSRRYQGYLRVRQHQYMQALVRVLLQSGQDLIQALGCGDVLTDLERRLRQPERQSCHGRLSHSILGPKPDNSPLGLEAGRFNQMAEDYYRRGLRRAQMTEALDMLEQDLAVGAVSRAVGPARDALSRILGGRDPLVWLRAARPAILGETLPENETIRLINLLLIIVHIDTERFAAKDEPGQAPTEESNGSQHPPVHRPAKRIGAN